MKKYLFLLAAVLFVSCQQKPATEEVWIQNGEKKIFGVLSRPTDRAKKSPLLIISHGFNGTHHFGMNYFPKLNEMGFMCYSFDFTYGSINSRSDNNTMNMSISDECSDLEAVINFFKNHPEVDPSRIVLLGESQGGLVSALTAEEMYDDVSELILIFPALCIPDNWNSRYPDLEQVPDTTWLWDVPLGRKLIEDLRDIEPYKNMESFEKPVLIIHGDKDPVVPIEYSYRAKGLYKDAELHVMEGAGHGFSPEQFAESVELITEFLY